MFNTSFETDTFDTAVSYNGGSELVTESTSNRRPNRFAQASAVEHPLLKLEDFLAKNGYDIGYGVYPGIVIKAAKLRSQKGPEVYGTWVEGQILSWNKYQSLDIASGEQNPEQKADYRTTADGKVTNKGENVEDYSRLMMEKHGKCEWKPRGSIYLELFRCEDKKTEIQPDTIVVLDMSQSSLNKWNQYISQCRLSGKIGEQVHIDVTELSSKTGNTWNAAQFSSLD